jgi:hypothetical protein
VGEIRNESFAVYTSTEIIPRQFGNRTHFNGDSETAMLLILRMKIAFDMMCMCYAVALIPSFDTQTPQ